MRKENIQTREYSYTVLFEPSQAGGYTATCPALPAVVTEGDTLDEARAMAKDAIRLYIEHLAETRQPIPTDVELSDEPVKEKVTIAFNLA